MNGSDPYALLASLYQTAREATNVARRAHLPIQFIETDGPAITVWGSILSEAKKRGMLTAIAGVVKQDYDVDIERSFSALAPVRNSPPYTVVAPRVPFSTSEYEQITGSQPTFLPIAFLSMGVKRAKSVVRVVCGDGSLGSGFITDRNLLLTNHHVLSSAEAALDAHIEFGYELTTSGTVRKPRSFKLKPSAGFHTSNKDDWTIVRVDGNANKSWGAIPVTPVAAKPEQFVNIIQHPGGGPKQLALYHNVVVFADKTRVQYLTDTMPGSSGSPVFNSRWELVALHHAGGWMRSPERKDALFCNEGIAAELISEEISQYHL